MLDTAQHFVCLDGGQHPHLLIITDASASASLSATSDSARRSTTSATTSSNASSSATPFCHPAAAHDPACLAEHRYTYRTRSLRYTRIAVGEWLAIVASVAAVVAYQIAAHSGHV